jgi:hypothetical protein
MSTPVEYGSNSAETQFPVVYPDVDKEGVTYRQSYYVKTVVKEDSEGRSYLITTLYEDPKIFGSGALTPDVEIGTLDSRDNTFAPASGASNSQASYFSSIEGKNTIDDQARHIITQEKLEELNTERPDEFDENYAAAQLYAAESADYTLATRETSTEKEKTRQAATFTVKGIDKPIQGTVWHEKAFSSKTKTLIYPEDHASEEFDFIKITPIEYVPALSGDSFTVGNTVNASGGGHHNIDIDDADWFGFKSVKQRYLRVKQVGSTMFLPMTPDIAENNGVDWGGDRLNPIQAAAGRVAFDAIGNIGNAEGFGGVAEALSTTAQDMAHVTNAFIKAPGMENFIKAYFAGKAVNANLLGRAGIVVNPNLEVLFNGPQLRSFQYNFRFTPRTKSEATTIRTIIKVLKKTMAPRRRDKIFLTVPAVYKIRYVFNGDTDDDHPFLNKIKPCALSGFNVSYAPDGSYMTYDDGSMTSYTVSMKFDELEPIYNDDIKDVDDATTGF